MAASQNTRKSRTKQRQSTAIPGPAPKIEPEIIAAKACTRPQLAQGVVRQRWCLGYKLTGSRNALIASGVKPEWLPPDTGAPQCVYSKDHEGSRVIASRTYGRKIDVCFDVRLAVQPVDRKKFEEALAEEEKEMKALFNSPDAYLESIRKLTAVHVDMMRLDLTHYKGGYSLRWWDVKGIEKALDKLLRLVRHSVAEYSPQHQERYIRKLKAKTAKADPLLQDVITKSLDAVKNGNVIAGAEVQS